MSWSIVGRSETLFMGLLLLLNIQVSCHPGLPGGGALLPKMRDTLVLHPILSHQHSWERACLMALGSRTKG